MIARLSLQVAAHGAGVLVVAAPSNAEVYASDWDQFIKQYDLDPNAWDAGAPDKSLAEFADLMAGNSSTCAPRSQPRREGTRFTAPGVGGHGMLPVGGQKPAR
jgi:hypothetical protein